MPTRDEVTAEIDAWLDGHWTGEHPLVEWRSLMVDAGWLVPSWPVGRLGRGLPPWADAVVTEAVRRHGAIGAPLGAGTSLAAPTLHAHASEDLCDRVMRPTLTGAATWCQLFSEPAAGSDLAGLRTTAVLDGDEWVVNGQKVWNTSAHHADLGLLLARTDWDTPKHRGLTMFVLPMRQEGVEVRPLHQMNGHSSFNEVFMTDARIPVADSIGSPGEGWRVALTTLAHERRFGSIGRPRFEGASGRTVDEAKREADEHFATYAWYPQRAGRPDLLIPSAQTNGTASDAVTRQQIVSALNMHRISALTAARATAARAMGREPGAEGSIGKLSMSNIARAAACAHGRITGAGAMLTGPTTAHAGAVAEVLVSVPAQSIAGGTDEIQRNILGERMLGLPPEPSVDRDVAFPTVAIGRTD
jgi:alkylation response protein AidB-like acyl-CoA dehydrogenase